MKETKTLTEVLSKLPLPQNSKITYQNHTIPYKLTVQGYTNFFLDSTPLPDLTPDEQLILINSRNNDPTFTPSKVIAGIFEAREIEKRSDSKEDAIKKCIIALAKENQNFFNARNSALQLMSENQLYANKLEYYLNNEAAMKKYQKQQASRLSFFRNGINKFLEKLTKKPFTAPPVSEKELEIGREAWQQFRKEQNATKNISNSKLLSQYRYHSNTPIEKPPFYFLLESPELQAHSENYTITNIALKILDGSALQKAEYEINKNPFQYLKVFKEEKSTNKTK